jgi:hypothetical protein
MHALIHALIGYGLLLHAIRYCTVSLLLMLLPLPLPPLLLMLLPIRVSCRSASRKS